jgi:hypothetical protein
MDSSGGRINPRPHRLPVGIDCRPAGFGFGANGSRRLTFISRPTVLRLLASLSLLGLLRLLILLGLTHTRLSLRTRNQGVGAI